MKRATLVLVMVVALVGFMAVSQANAKLILTIADGLGNVKTITSSGDSIGKNTVNLGDGVFTINSVSVNTQPMTPDEVFADIGSYDFTSSEAGTLTITLEDTNLSLPTPPDTALLTNTVSGNLTGDGDVISSSSATLSYTVTTKKPKTTTTYTSTPLVVGGVDGSASEIADFQDPFTLTDVITLSFGANSGISMDDQISAAVPEPASLFLVVGGLLVLGFVQRRRLGNMA